MAGTLNANQIIPDQGQTLYINGIDYAANVVIGNTNTTIASFTPTGNVTVQGTITANGITSASGNLSVSGAVSATGNVSGNFVTATNNISANNISTTNNVTANNISSSYDITAASFNGGPLGGMRNRIINGAMMIDQRNAGAAVTPTDAAYTLDRWRFYLTQSSKLTTQQSTTAPVGFINSMLITSTSSYSVSATDIFAVNQLVEGLNCSDLAWGTSNAKSVTLSFQVYSSLTGTFGGALSNSALNRSYPFTYSVPVANTWTSISVTIPGDTSGTWLTTTGVGIRVYFGLGVGSTYSGTAGSWAGTQYNSATGAVSVVGTSGATWYVTGVQLEKGATATPFENRMYGTELALCQRYYVSFSVGGYMGATAFSTNRVLSGFTIPAVMRSSPTVSFNGTCYFFYTGVSSTTTTPGLSATEYGFVSIDSSMTAPSGQSGAVALSGGKVTLSAEL